ncbi:ThiF family adenylyltransferase [Streptomyces sp. NPDC004647]|uniref:ThiF family adenylyltransferase n=1 Tax=Streptomyces sp. NPDC004647 TaxID=3154671 RepID=UPI0033A9EB5E
MHPMLKPALRRGWRNRQTVQFGVAAAHAVVLGPVDTATGSFLSLLDGTRGLSLLRKEAEATGLTAERADELVDRLETAGLLDDPTAGRSPAAAGEDRRAAWDRLRPDLASLSVVHPEPGGAARRMAAREAISVQVRGAGRVGAAIAAALSASGVGQVEVTDGGCVEPWDVVPSGVPADSVGERRSVAARRVVRAAAPGLRPRRTESAGAGTALVVLAPRDGLSAYAPDPLVAEELIASGTPHLYAGVIEGTGVVGPLVLPGGSACTGCLALDRAEREPAWPRMLAQWRSGRGGSGAVACDTALATVVTGLAASHALTFLDGQLPVSAGARLEFALPDLLWEPRRIAPHPSCGCGAAGAAPGPCGEAPSVAEERHGTMAGRPPSAVPHRG